MSCFRTSAKYTGAPLTWGNYIYNGNFKDIAISSDEQSLTKWFNTAGFEKVSANQLANNVRTFPLRFSYLRVQPTNNVDFSLIKNTQIKERMRFQFRAEFTNAFNHPWLSAASGASGTSGVITNPTNADFGKIANLSNQGNYARRVQLGFKLLF